MSNPTASDNTLPVTLRVGGVEWAVRIFSGDVRSRNRTGLGLCDPDARTITLGTTTSNEAIGRAVAEALSFSVRGKPPKDDYDELPSGIIVVHYRKGEGDYVCSSCKKGYRSMRWMEFHLLRVHKLTAGTAALLVRNAAEIP